MAKQNSKLKALRSGNTIVLHYNGQTLNIQKSSRPTEFRRVEKLLEANDTDGLVEAFVDIKKAIEQYSKDKITVEQGTLIDKKTGKSIPKPIAKKLLDMRAAGKDFKPLWRFWLKLRENPNPDSVDQAYTFIEKNNIPITEQGDLVVEKGVYMKSDGSLWDDRTKTMDNSIGMIVEMPREKVDSNRNQTCSHGLHVAAPDYVKQVYSNSVVIECIVNPKDIVSVPTDYNATKMRVCRYQVMGLAKHSSIKELVVKLEDFTQLPAVAERRSHGFDDSVPVNTFTDLMKLTAKGIVSYVRKTTGKRITIDPKNKVSIAKKAEAILQAAGKSDLPSSEKKKNAKKEIVFTGKKCSEIIEMIAKILGADETAKLAGNDPRRGRFIAKVTPILKEQGYTVVD